jgi:cytochrome c oxidase assembly protein subunit 15
LKSTVKVLYLLSILWVYLVILAGGSVRASGAGMGCPDWPLCFGQFIPPLSFNDLPPNWTEYLHGSSAVNPQFNPIHTWIEYTNRLFGVVLGLLTSILVFCSFFIRKTYPIVFICALGALLAVCFNGWLGSRVVASDLRPVTVSLHMLGAFVIQVLLIFGFLRLNNFKNKGFFSLNSKSIINYVIVASLICLIFQIGMGIQIRESIDWVLKTTSDVNRGELLTMVPWIYYIHRSFSWIIFIFAFLILYLYISPRYNNQSNFFNQIKVLFINDKKIRQSFIYLFLVFSQMLIGGALNHLGFPLIAQPLHLLVANLLFGALCIMLFDNSEFISDKKDINYNKNRTALI